MTCYTNTQCVKKPISWQISKRNSEYSGEKWALKTSQMKTDNLCMYWDQEAIIKIAKPYINFLSKNPHWMREKFD